MAALKKMGLSADKAGNRPCAKYNSRPENLLGSNGFGILINPVRIDSHPKPESKTIPFYR